MVVERLVLKRRFDGAGVLRYLDDGLSPTLDDLAWLMIIVSDNSATAMLVEALGDPGIQQDRERHRTIYRFGPLRDRRSGMDRRGDV
jgi:beta-lactamase class A